MVPAFLRPRPDQSSGPGPTGPRMDPPRPDPSAAIEREQILTRLKTIQRDARLTMLTVLGFVGGVLTVAAMDLILKLTKLLRFLWYLVS